MATQQRQMRLTPELVARIPAYPGDERPKPNSTRDPAYNPAAARAILDKVPADGALWVFAFGSLMWKPAAEFEEAPGRPALVRGWHRAFCLGWDRYYRGSRENPGLMLSLDRGGQCRGLLFRIRREALEANLTSLIGREPPVAPRWVRAVTTDGDVEAVAFVNDRKGPAYIGGLSDDQIADSFAKACGHLGSMADYLHNTVVRLEEIGIHDGHLWRMQELVAARLEAMGSPPKG